MSAENKPSEKPRADEPQGLPSLSVFQLARRLGLRQRDVVDYIVTQGLRAHVFLPGRDPRNRGGESLRQYDLPPSVAKSLLTEPLSSSFQIELVDSKTRRRRRFEFGEDIRGSDVRVLEKDVECFQKKYLGKREPEADTKDAGKPRRNQLAKQSVRAVAAFLWHQEPTLNIEDMLQRPELRTFGLQRWGYPDYKPETVRNWIHDLCPDPKPGRPRKAN